jgi:hypothetical protein
MEVKTSLAGGVIFSFISVGAAMVSFQPEAFWAFAISLAAILCGILGLLLVKTTTGGRGLWGVFAMGAGVIGIVLGAVKAIGWVTPLLLHS